MNDCQPHSCGPEDMPKNSTGAIKADTLVGRHQTASFAVANGNEYSRSVSLSKTLAILALIFFCFSFVVAPHFDLLPTIEPYNESRILELLTLLLVTCCFFWNSSLRNSWFTLLGEIPTTSKLLMLAAVLLGLFSATRTLYPAFAFLEVSMFVLLFLAALCMAVCRRSLGMTFDRVMFCAIVVMSLPYLTGFLGHYLLALSGEVSFERDVLFGNFANVRFFNQMQGWTLAFVVLPVLFWAGRSPVAQWVCIIAAINWWMLLFISGGRGILLSCLLAFPFTLVIYREQARAWFRWQVMTAMVGFAAYFFLILILPRVFSLDFQASQIGLLGRSFTSSSRRLELWIDALEMVRSSPLLGVGPMHFAASPSVPFANPHNALLQLAAEWGVPVVLIVLALFLWGVTRWLSHRRSVSSTEEQPELRVALFAALLTSALYSLFDGVIVMPVSQLLLALIIGWMLGVMPAGPDTSRPVSRIRTMVSGLLLAVVLIGVLRPVFSTVLCLEQLQADYIHAHPQATHLNPRFWQQGYLSGYSQTSPCR